MHNLFNFLFVLGKEVFAVRIVGSLNRNGSFWITKIGEPAMEKQKDIQMAIKYDY